MRIGGCLITMTLLTGLLLSTGCTPPILQTTTPAEDFDEAAFWESLPMPDDATLVPARQNYGLAFVTGMAEPELFDFYAQWLRGRDWNQQAPTEAMVTLPHQRWRKGDVELLIELEAMDEQERSVVRFLVALLK
jgi:hypothetical protein